MDAFAPPTDEVEHQTGPGWLSVARLTAGGLWLGLVGMWFVERTVVYGLLVNAMGGELDPSTRVAVAQAAIQPAAWVSAGRYMMVTVSLGLLIWRPPPRAREPSFALLVGLCSVTGLLGAVVCGPLVEFGLVELPVQRWVRVMLELGSLLVVGQLLDRAHLRGWANRSSVAALLLGGGRLGAEVLVRLGITWAPLLSAGVSLGVVGMLTVLVGRLLWRDAGGRSRGGL